MPETCAWRSTRCGNIFFLRFRLGVTVFALRKLGVNDEGILIKEHYNESGVRVSS